MHSPSDLNAQHTYKNKPQELRSFIEKQNSINLIEPLNLTSLEIENSLRNQKIIAYSSFQKGNKKRLNFQAPELVATFYHFIYHFSKLPSQQAFIEFYKYIHNNWSRKFINRNQDNKTLLNERLRQFYLSMLRDFHFFHIIKETNKIDNIGWQLTLDLHYKTDFVIKQKNEFFGLQLFVNTKSSNEFYNKKTNNNNHFPKIKSHIPLPLDFKKAKSIKSKQDDMLLYDDKIVIPQILNQIKKINTFTTV